MDNGAESYRRFLQGDDTAFVEIIRDYKDGLILYLNGFVNNILTAEELTEDVFFKLVTKKPRFNEKSSFKTWLYTIGRNTAVDYLRRNSKQKEVSAEEIREIEDERLSLEQSYIKQERLLLIHRTLEKLKPEYKQVLWLVYFEDFSQKETAKIMKKSVHSVETLVYRARLALKAELEKGGFIYEDI
ncbi:MAG: RNA polymerase sigma factor [Acutalibacteraceae bacterium]|nr:RNA polymerase sigma factor [Acutalibacteraceae bacterium]